MLPDNFHGLGNARDQKWVGEVLKLRIKISPNFRFRRKPLGGQKTGGERT
jgi:hypothetical protein